MLGCSYNAQVEFGFVGLFGLSVGVAPFLKAANYIGGGRIEILWGEIDLCQSDIVCCVFIYIKL